MSSPDELWSFVWENMPLWSPSGDSCFVKYYRFVVFEEPVHHIQPDRQQIRELPIPEMQLSEAIAAPTRKGTAKKRPAAASGRGRGKGRGRGRGAVAKGGRGADSGTGSPSASNSNGSYSSSDSSDAGGSDSNSSSSDSQLHEHTPGDDDSGSDACKSSEDDQSDVGGEDGYAIPSVEDDTYLEDAFAGALGLDAYEAEEVVDVVTEPSDPAPEQSATPIPFVPMVPPAPVHPPVVVAPPSPPPSVASSTRGSTVKTLVIPGGGKIKYYTRTGRWVAECKNRDHHRCFLSRV